MNEDQRKWLLDLQSKGIKFENVSVNGKTWYKGTWEFKNDPKDYRIQSQSIPDIPDWRELCREMQSKGVRFKMLWGSMWNEDRHDFEKERDRYQLIEQPLPKWREEMTKETKPDPREEIPHWEQQIQWHEDALHHLRTGEPMREWEWQNTAGDWVESTRHLWDTTFKYRRKPRTVTYWTFVMQSDGEPPEVIIGYALDETKHLMKYHKEAYQSAKFSSLTEITTEMED